MKKDFIKAEKLIRETSNKGRVRRKYKVEIITEEKINKELREMINELTEIFIPVYMVVKIDVSKLYKYLKETNSLKLDEYANISSFLKRYRGYLINFEKKIK